MTDRIKYVLAACLLTISFGIATWPGAFAQSQSTPTGAFFKHYLSTASTNANLVKTGVTTLYSVTAVNTNAATAWLKFYNVTAAPTCNTSTVHATIALVQNIPVTASFPIGVTHGNGLGLCITGASPDNDNTNATTGITVSVSYK